MFVALSAPTSSSQIVAIDALLTLFEKWRLLAPPSLLQNNKTTQMSWPSATPQQYAPPTPIASQDPSNNPFHALEQEDSEQEAPSVPLWSPPPLPASVPRTPAPALRASHSQEATPTRLVFEDTPAPQRSPLLPLSRVSTLPRVSTPPSAGPQRIPVAHRTRARLAPPQLSSIVELVEYHVPTAKTTRREPPNSNHFTGLCQALGLSAPEESEFAGLCEKLTILDDGDALAVLDRESGKLLEHRQLRKDPRYKSGWDHLYTNELGPLCQGIGTGN
jgi:hypothetical protein